MQLKKVYVDGYKNLIDTSVEVTSRDIPIAIIGNNGTGKSNLIEALLHIFIGLYFGKPTFFTFEIEYESHGKEVKVIRNTQNNVFLVEVDGNEWSWSYFKKRVREIDLMPPFPALVFCYYSGTCDRTKKLIKKYGRSYEATLRRQTQNLERLFVFSDIDQANYCLLGLIAHDNVSLLNRLSIGGIDKLKLTLNNPKLYSLEKDEPKYWGTSGAVREFLSVLDNSSKESYQPFKKRTDSDIQELRTYILEKEELIKVGIGLEQRGTNFYSMLQTLDAKKMVFEVNYKVKHSKSDVFFGIDDLSEGEKQLLCVIGGLKLSNQDECLVLLDEPDTHLNPNWSWEYETLLKDALVEMQQQTSTVLLATHDPVMISGLTKEQVFIAQVVDKNLIYSNPIRNPRGQGVANILTSEFYGLPSSLDKNTQNLLDERLALAYSSTRLTDEERKRLNQIEDNLQDLGLTIAFRDPEYAVFERDRNNSNTRDARAITDAVRDAVRIIKDNLDDRLPEER